MGSTFFGVQVAISVPSGAAMRGQLAACVRELRERTDVAAQRAAWVRAAAALRDGMAGVRLGSWDLLRSGGEAAYEEWATGLEAMAEWPQSEFGEGGDLLLVTIIALVAPGSNADRSLGDLCDVAEPLWHRRDTYRALLTAMPLLNLTNLLGSGLYLAPHPDSPGYSMEVLRGEGFEYLEPVT
jgi:hypothetical protein